MAPKSIPVSFRISPDDAAFIAKLKIDGAVTPSEKIRGLIAKAQRDHESRHTFNESTAVMREALAPTLAAIEGAELSLEIHSELMRVVCEWLPEAMASCITSVSSIEANASQETLVRAERAVADRTVRLLEGVLRMAITRQCDAYDPDLFARRLDRVLELADLIKQHRAELASGSGS